MIPTAGLFSTHAAVFSSTNVHLCFLRSSGVWFSFSSRDTALVMSALENKLKALTLCSGKCTRGHTCKVGITFRWPLSNLRNSRGCVENASLGLRGHLAFSGRKSEVEDLVPWRFIESLPGSRCCLHTSCGLKSYNNLQRKYSFWIHFIDKNTKNTTRI